MTEDESDLTMNSRSPRRDTHWVLLLAGLGLLGSLLIAVSFLATPAVPPGPTPTPTPTPSPTPTATPTPTPVPSPTATPESPATVSCGPDVPADVCGRLRQAVDDDPVRLAWVDDPVIADIQLRTDALPDSRPFATWIYALVAPFYTVEDGVSGAELRDAWGGEPTGPFVERPLLMSAETREALPLGEAAGDVRLVEASDLLAQAIELDAWAIVPFHALEPRWKVLRVDDISPLDRELDMDVYPLATTFHLGAENRSDALGLLPPPVTNRDPEKMSVVMLTGVTALARQTAVTMEREGVTFAGRDIREWMTEPDITHTSNEVPFTEDCPPPTGESTLIFCSDPRYFELFEYVGVDVVELTGNHVLDWGVAALENTLRMFEASDISTYGGGWNVADAQEPLTMTHGVHTFGFIGCNPVNVLNEWATADRPGAAPCDFDLIAVQIQDMREQGVIPIVTFQHWEYDRYQPHPNLITDFRAVAEAGAAIVSGSQAHWPQGFDFHAGAFIHYGLGNLFFDQVHGIGYRQTFLDRHVFYDGRHISTELLTAMIEDYARPRPMTLEERRALLQATFAVSEW